MVQKYFTPIGYSVTCFNLAAQNNWAMVVGPGKEGTSLKDLGFTASRDPNNWGTPAETLDEAISVYGTLAETC